MPHLEDALQTNKFESDIQKAHLHILFTASWLKTSLLQKIKPFGIYLEQYNVLRILRGASPQALCVKEISHRMIDKNSNTTRIIEKLLAKKLVHKERSTDDKREWNISLSPQGGELLAQIDAHFSLNPLHQSNLNPEEIQLLIQLLEKLHQ